MGKSSKKVKNDRINMLRKKYDAFLEEDKKRKERNEYILGKLDKMRLSTSLIPSSTKVNCREANPPDVYIPPNNARKDLAIYDNYVLQLERQHVNNSTILNEITKKYILIPKRTVLSETKYTYQKDVIDDRDWKSKYNILDDLKKQEKEGSTDNGLYQSNNIFLSSQKDSEYPTKDKPSHILDDNSNHFNKPICINNNELIDVNKTITSSEQGKNNNTIHFGISENNSQSSKENLISPQNPYISSTQTLKDNNVEADHTIKDATISNQIVNQENVREKENYYSTDNEKNKLSSVNNLNQNIDNHYQIKEENDNQLNYQENEFQSNQSLTEASEYVAHENISDAIYSKQIVSDIKPQGNSAVELSQENLNKNYENQQHPSDNQDLAPVQQVYEVIDNDIKGPIESNQTYGAEYHEITKDNIPKEISDENINDDNYHFGYSGATQVLEPAEQVHGDVNQPGVQIESNQSTFDETQHYDASQDMIPVVIENTENMNLDSEINAFEAEQKEMFYTEQTDGNTYAYNQEDENAGNYTAQEYGQNDQYAYYEGVQQDQAYSTGINEHEESTERYDPHFNQQYEASYENQQPDGTVNYENTNAYEQQQFEDGSYVSPQFQNIVSYENQEENTNLHQKENASNQNENEESNMAAQGDQLYNEHVYTEQADSQENIEQQLSIEEGVAEISSNVDEYHKENDPINEIMDTSAPVEQSQNPKYI